jgi:hypothetical protein
MDDSLLGKWRIGLTDYRTVNGRIIKSVQPNIKYPVARRVSRVEVIV